MGRIDIDQSEPGAAIVSLVGEHEDFSVPELERALDQAIQERRAVVVDLGLTEFLSSTVVTTLLRARDDAHVRGCRFAVVVDDSTGAAVHRLIEITGLGAMLPLVGSRAEALSA